MTNKKFKIAAMSMALTACVAAQPLMANAAETDEVKEPVSNANENEAEGSAVAEEPSAVDAPVVEETKGEEPAAQTESGDEDASEEPIVQNNADEGTGKESVAQDNTGDVKVEAEKPADGSNKEEDNLKEAFGENVDIDYGDPKTDDKTGETTTKGDVVKKDDTDSADADKKDDVTDETGDQDKTDGDKKADEKTDGTDGDQKTGETVDDKKTDEVTPPADGDKTEKDDKDEGEKIGDATITETPNPGSTVKEDPKPGAEPVTKTDTKVDSDGTTTITNTTTVEGTQTTTTTGKGHAEADTKETTEDTKEIDKDFLDKELGTIDWGVKKDDKVGTDKENQYTVISKEEKTTGDKTKQTLTLEKVEETKGNMTAEDIAKLVDADRDSVNKQEDGSYTLKRTETVTDEDGNPVTRTTYITVKDSEVTIKTTTTITVTREKEEHHEEDDKSAFENDTASDFTLPDIPLYDKETNKKVDSIDEKKLNDLINDKNTKTKIDGTKTTYTVTVEEDGVKREYTITKDSQSKELTAKEIADRMGDGFVDRGNDVFYVDANGKEWKLTVDQKNVIREKLSYTIDVKETKKGTETTEGKDKAEADAKDEAVRSALNNAVKKMLEDGTITEDEAKELNKKIADATIDAAKGGTFKTDITVDGVKKHFELDYSEGTITGTTETPREDKDNDKTTDNKDLTANGSSYVTSGTVSWTDSETGEGKHSKFEGKGFTAPDDKYLTDSKDLGGNKVEKIYTVVSEDGKTTTIYKVIEENIELSDLDEDEKNNLAWAQLEEETGKSREQLEKEGYKVTDVTFTGSIKKVSWNITETTTKTDEKKEDLSDIIYVDGGKKWTIDEKAGTITVDGKTYTNVKKNDDGSYTCEEVDPNNDKTNYTKTSYTFTEKNSTRSLPEGQIKELLAAQLQKDFPNITITANDITLNDDGTTASYTKDGKTVTIDYSKLGKDLEVKKEEHYSTSTTVTIKKDENYQKNFNAACQELLDQIKRDILPDVEKEGKELWLGNTKVTKDTPLTQDIIDYITKAVSSDNMSHDELIKALEDQARVAQSTKVTVNEGKKDHHGNDIQETLKNFYEGDKEGTYFVKPNGSIYLGDNVNYDWETGEYYYLEYDPNDRWAPATRIPLTKQTGKKDTYISHLDLASDSQLELLPDANGKSETTDCVLISKDLKLEWNYKADDLVHDKNNTTVSLKDTISFDSEDGKKGSGHYEYNRGSNYEKTLPTKSAYYKLTGTVVYDVVKDDTTGKVKQYNGNDNGYKQAKKAYLEATGRSSKEVTDEEYAKHIVKIDGKWQVYKKSSELEAYGYMSRDANTCTNRTYRNQDHDDGYYVGGYDLMISKLVQVREGKIVGQTESSIKTITAPWSIRSSETKADDWLQLTQKTTETTTTTTPEEVDKGSNSTTTGDFKYNYTHDQEDTFDWTEGGTTSGVEGTGGGLYSSFVNWVSSLFHGESGEQTKEGGSFHYSYDYTTVGDLQGENLTQTVEKHAEVNYDYTTKETKDVDIIIDQEITVITPDDDGPVTPVIPIVTPDTPVSPANPELPPVQDARPDAVLPVDADTPVLPANPELPAVQDAHALPQTGVNWLTAIAMAVSGFTLMAAGAFASLTGKNAKH